MKEYVTPELEVVWLGDGLGMVTATSYTSLTQGGDPEWEENPSIEGFVDAVVGKVNDPAQDDGHVGFGGEASTEPEELPSDPVVSVDDASAGFTEPSVDDVVTGVVDAPVVDDTVAEPEGGAFDAPVDGGFTSDPSDGFGDLPADDGFTSDPSDGFADAPVEDGFTTDPSDGAVDNPAAGWDIGGDVVTEPSDDFVDPSFGFDFGVDPVDQVVDPVAGADFGAADAGSVDGLESGFGDIN